MVVRLRLQILLMRASTREDRKRILHKLFDEEQGLSGTTLGQLPRLMKEGQPVELSKLQQSLGPDELVLEYALRSTPA